MKKYESIKFELVLLESEDVLSNSLEGLDHDVEDKTWILSSTGGYQG